LNRRAFLTALFAAAVPVKVNASDGARRSFIAASMRALAAERDALGKGDYKKWYDSLAELRKGLRAVMDREQHNGRELFRADGTPPLFCELYTGDYVALKEPDFFAWTDSLRGPEAVLATSRWLKKKGVDLIFVPVPKMSDVYMDRIVPDGVPADKISGPHLRRVLLELLRNDVEVIDLLPDFLRAREQSKDPLYLPADTHWSPAGRAICIRRLAERLDRYPVAQAARKSEPLFTVVKATLQRPMLEGQYPMSLLPNLTVEERTAVEPFLYPECDNIARKDGSFYGSFDSGPVILIGDSYSNLLGEQLAHAINMPVVMYPVPGGTVQAVKELLRNREALAQAKVVVWVVNYAIFFLHDWSGLPEVVRRELPAPPAAIKRRK
jgi:hypothetical protein